MLASSTEYTQTNKSSSLEKTILEIGNSIKLTLDDVKLLARKSIPVKLCSTSLAKMQDSYLYLKNCIDNRMPIYGVNTNFGDQVGFVDANLKDQHEMPSYEAINLRQENLIRSLACSLGAPVNERIIKITMLLRAQCLSQGYSGINPEIVKYMLNYLNAGITPIVGHYGSIGASGDLIPLSSIAAAMIGESVNVMYHDKIMTAPQAMQLAGIPPLKPQLRDGLAMINGTSFMTAIASISLYDLRRLFRQMLSVIGMALESMLVISSAYHPLVHDLKNQSGEVDVNRFLKSFWKDSQLLSDLDELRQRHLINDDAEKTPVRTVQDYYSLRAVAQGFGPFLENLERAIVWIENEMNSVNDNPIIDAANKQIHHGANFMGYYVTDSCDILKMNISQASTWIHALLANLVHPRKNHHLPANLVENPGKNNGFRSLQLLAAALAVQNRKLAQSHQSFSLPTEGDNQDVNSLGTHAALDFKESVSNLERLTAILFLASSQALEFRGIEKASTRSQEIYKLIRLHSPTVLDCRPMSDELNTIAKFLEDELI